MISFKDYVNSRVKFYKKHLVDLTCGLILCVLAIDGAIFTLKIAVENQISIVEGILLWITQPLIIITLISMFGVTFSSKT